MAQPIDLAEALSTVSHPWSPRTVAVMNRRLQQDVDILKRATAFFAKETR